jgi:hypothetical protein
MITTTISSSISVKAARDLRGVSRDSFRIDFIVTDITHHSVGNWLL